MILSESGGGKSHWISHLDRRGFEIMGDDILAVKRVGRRWTAYPSYPFVRLDRSLENLGEPLKNFCPVGREVDSGIFMRYNETFSSILKKPMRGGEKIEAMESAREFHLPWNDPERFAQWSAWIRDIPLWSVQLPRDTRLIDRVIDQWTEERNTK